MRPILGIQMRQKLVIAAALLWLLPASVCAQWLNFKTPGIPRTADGKPDLTAPAPRTADGHSDLSGLWQQAPNFLWLDMIQDVKDEAIFKPAARAVFQKRAAEYNVDGPYTRCLPLGPGDIFLGTFRVFQSPTEVALLRNGVGTITGRSSWTGANFRRTQTRHGGGIPWVTGTRIRSWSKQMDSTTRAGSIKWVTLVPRSFTLRRDFGASISGTSNFRSLLTTPRH